MRQQPLSAKILISSENDKDNRVVIGNKNQGKVITAGSKKRMNKMKRVSDSWLDCEQVIHEVV
jgi:hypothetical protein